jgi:hypothetical protein
MGLYDSISYERVKHAKRFSVSDCVTTFGIIWVIVDPATWLQYMGIALVAFIAGLPTHADSDWRED